MLHPFFQFFTSITVMKISPNMSSFSDAEHLNELEAQ